MEKLTKQDFRILEYKDHFRVQRRNIINSIVYVFFGLPLKYKEKEEWHTLIKDGSAISFRGAKSMDVDFKNKEEALQLIEDLIKYPIIHNL